MRSSKLLLAVVVTFLAVFSTPRVAAGQGGTIRGRVVDSTGAPIGQAVVVLDPGGQRATTRDNGEYTIPQVAPGTYTVRLRRLGYAAPSAIVVVANARTVEQGFVVRRQSAAAPPVARTVAAAATGPASVITPPQ